MVFLPYFETIEAMKMQGLNKFAYHVAISRVQRVARFEQVVYLPSKYCNSLQILREKKYKTERVDINIIYSNDARFVQMGTRVFFTGGDKKPFSCYELRRVNYG